jgi:hypothetical protein
MKGSGDCAAHSPCPRGQKNATVILNRKAFTNAIAQCGTTIFGKRHAVAWRWGLTPKKRRPVVIKVLEYRWSINLSDFHIIEPGMPKEARQKLFILHGNSSLRYFV